MSLDEEILELVAKNGQMDYERWPALLEPLLERLDHIVHNEFRIPQIPAYASFETIQTLPLMSQSQPASESLPNSNKENAPPSLAQSPQRPPVPSFSSQASASIDRIPDSQNSQLLSNGLPPPLITELSAIKSTLRSYFSQKPPHTIQRLAELILRPTKNYKTLPAYLRAVDRVVSVSSGADIFPLPVSLPADNLLDSSLANGVNGSTSTAFMLNDNSLGSDESLGGALLTPIPWLNNSTPSSDDDDIMQEVGGQTRAENLPNSNQETQHMGNVNQGQDTPASRVDAETDAPHVLDPENEEVPHARGPDVLGVQDLGLQNGKGVTMSLARTSPPPGSSGESVPATQDASADKTIDEDAPGEPDADAEADADGDIDIMDTGPKNESGQMTSAASGNPEVGAGENNDK
ncbi:hypothetical protein MGYG_01689 [Nannizzia gypsea CBS 118893]|uniref:Uncharacterized protein n=1 Tax=Arthroderma gypseum (strain ATCC MYA-4604 / CBS 118893) TaxID=535722 RepID=E5R2L0_ARTGP|nr:hypothetical protein MGYG_01689 [Nannizzia gypsea CBS 118893]EFQ98668.1 hypothetical protein MGYG_01689 [Nannizzia gypsea CBS 118893]